MGDTRRIYGGLLSLNLSLLLFELTLIRVYSVTLFYHFAFMAISVAMLGIAAAGLTVYFYTSRFSREKVCLWTSRWSAAYSVSILLVLWIVFHIPVNTFLPPDQVAFKLTLIYILSAIPFYLAGLVISGIFASSPKNIGRLYSLDLIGAGLGAILIIPLIDYTGGETAGLYIMSTGFIATAIFSKTRLRKMGAALAIVALVLSISNPYVGWLKIKYSKGNKIAYNAVWYNRWNSFSRIMAIPFKPGTNTPQTWAPSPNYPLPSLPHFTLTIDDGSSTPVVPFNGKDYTPIEYLKYDLTSLGHILRGSGETLIIGSGGGRDVLTGLIFGAERVDAVDINPLIFEAMNGPLAKFGGYLYRMEKVRPIVAEGRAFARRHPQSYDLIQVAMIDTWAATIAGAYSLSENTLYTVEAFEDYLNALKKDGILTFTRFFFTPPRQALRLFTLFIDAADRLGIEDIDQCILVAKYNNLATLLFKRESFTSAEITQFMTTLRELGFELVYAPDQRPDRIFAEVMEIEDREQFYQRYPFDVSPPTDNRPFFFNMLKERDFLRIFGLREGLRFNYYATFTLVIVLLISIVATIFTLILPVIVKTEGISAIKGRVKLLLYFICIGLAYITIEVALLQRFVLLLEHPAYAASAVVALMLISSGIGSLVWGKIDIKRRKRLFLIGFAAIGIMLMFHILFGGRVIHSLLSFHLYYKMCLAALLLIPLGAAMGIPLPAGMTIAGDHGKSAVAWCWALNGAASVAASSLAVVIAMAYGFSTVLFAGLIFYLMAFFLLTIIMRKDAVEVVV